MLDTRKTAKTSILNGLLLTICGITIFEGYFWALAYHLFGPQYVRYLIWSAVIILSFWANRFKLKKTQVLIPWLLYILSIVILNQEFKIGEYINTERVLLCVVTIFACIASSRWIETTPYLIAGMGLVNVCATTAFFFNNSLYESFIRMTYGTYQNGTGNGMYGYRAGIADHYSQNGTYIAITVVVLMTLLLTNKTKKKKYVLPLLLLSIFSLLLTGKRAQLLFVVCTAIALYYIENPAKRVTKLFKLMVIVAVAAFALGLSIEYIPQLRFVFERISSSGTDAASLKRFMMWNYAIDMFKQHPAFGNGFWAFRYDTGITGILIDAKSGCHNIYLETMVNGGILGFLLVIYLLAVSLKRTIKNINFCNDNADLACYKQYLLVSAGIQLFFILLGFTENTLFDRTFNFYVIAIAMSLAFDLNLKRKVSYRYAAQ